MAAFVAHQFRDDLRALLRNRQAQFFTIMAFGIIAAAFINLVVSVTAQRESGVLKRRRATPIPAVALIGGRALTSVVVAIATTAVLLGIGWLGYGAHLPGRTAPALVVTIVVGTLSFCCLGFTFPPIITSVQRAIAVRRRPYLCPKCGAPVEPD
jgi:ABC-2 type transport system permease protein